MTKKKRFKKVVEWKQVREIENETFVSFIAGILSGFFIVSVFINNIYLFWSSLSLGTLLFIILFFYEHKREVYWEEVK